MGLGIGKSIDSTRDRDAGGSFYMEPPPPLKKKRRKKKKKQQQEAKPKEEVDVESVLAIAGGKDKVEQDISTLRPPIVANAFRTQKMLTMRDWLEQHPFEPLENASAVVDFPRDWGTQRGRYSRFEGSVDGTYNVLRGR
jgi:hypothetical protein